uniref:SOCS box domain-containing protein n=1 Tax=Canis lupus familiaris TaxID=9615 RepID=A0A8C0PPJ2_CANLF
LLRGVSGSGRPEKPGDQATSNFDRLQPSKPGDRLFKSKTGYTSLTRWLPRPAPDLIGRRCFSPGAGLGREGAPAPPDTGDPGEGGGELERHGTPPGRAPRPAAPRRPSTPSPGLQRDPAWPCTAPSSSAATPPQPGAAAGPRLAVLRGAPPPPARGCSGTPPGRAPRPAAPRRPPHPHPRPGPELQRDPAWPCSAAPPHPQPGAAAGPRLAVHRAQQLRGAPHPSPARPGAAAGPRLSVHRAGALPPPPSSPQRPAGSGAPTWLAVRTAPGPGAAELQLPGALGRPPRPRPRSPAQVAGARVSGCAGARQQREGGMEPRTADGCFLGDVGFWVERTPVHEAAQRGEALQLQRLIESGACVNQVTVDSITPLHAASLQGQAQCVQLLLAAGAQVDARNIDGSTPLCDACASGSIECVKLLLSYGAKVNPPLYTASPLHEACMSGSSECVRLLIDVGANLEAHDCHFGTPLHVACAREHLDCVKVLLNAGANVNAAKLHETALHHAAKVKNVDLIEMLVEFGGNIYARDNRGKKPSDYTWSSSAPAKCLEFYEKTPLSLSQLCRVSLRKATGVRGLEKISKLNIPPRLIDYLSYN